MGLTDVQSALARLFTESALRESLFLDPQRAAEELGLSACEAAQVAQLSAAQVGYFAASLIAKRRHEVEKLLPLTHHLLGRQFHDAFEHYAAVPIPHGLQKHHADALGFAAFYQEQGLLLNPPWSMDVLRYETAWLEAASPQRRWLFRRFRYPVSAILCDVVKDPAVTFPTRTTLGLWFRVRPEGPLRHLLLPVGR